MSDLHALRPSMPWLNGRRAFLASIVLATSIGGCIAMAQVVANFSMGWQLTMLILFALTFTWIALAFWGALCGFVLCALRRDPLSLRRQTIKNPNASLLVSRTALIMPIYAEPPIPTIAGLEATCRSLLQQAEAYGAGTPSAIHKHFEVFVLSDTQDMAMANIEAAHVAALQQRLAGQITIHYRRRLIMTAAKLAILQSFAAAGAAAMTTWWC